MEPETLEYEDVLVRGLKPDDMESVVALDAKITGRRREEYFKLKLKQALADTGVVVSLAAEHDGMFAGFLLCRVFYGDFGRTEQGAILETLGVHPNFQGKGVARALLEQLKKNLSALRVPVIHTEVDWDTQEMISFFHHSGFKPAPRLCLDLDLEQP